ncbi:cadherin-like domain-containing protein [Methylobacterium sp. CM6241]
MTLPNSTTDVTGLNKATGIITTASRVGTLKTGDTVTFTLEAETAVTVTGAPRLTLSNGATATYAGLDGEGRATFTYTIAAGEDDARLTVTGLDLNGGSLDRPGLLDFATAPNVTVGGAPASVTVADVNEDGKLDILTANNSSNTVSVRLGDGAGGFSGTTNVSVGSEPGSVTVADVNGDGHLDILTANSGNDTVSVRLGDGAGGFSGTTDLAVGSEPRSATVADVNGDGRLDILVANNDGRTVSVLLNTTTTALSFDPASVSSATTGSDTDLAIDATAPALTGTQTVLADGTEDTAYTVTEAQLLEGWADAGTAMLTVSGLTSSSGTVTANSDGSFTITPAANATGPVTLTYGVSDGTNAPAPATRSFSLTAVNDAPLLTGTQATLVAGTEDTAFTVTADDLLQGFADPEGTTLVLSNLSVDHGTIVGDGAGGYTVRPDANYSGQITISYSVGDGAASIPATLSTTLAAVNDAPRLTGTQATLAAGREDAAYTGRLSNLLKGFTDTDSASLAVTNLRADHGTVTITGGTFTLTPDADYNGLVTLSYDVGDGTAITAATRALTLASVNDAPVATDDVIEVVQRNSVASGVLGNDIDPDSGTLTITAIRAVTAGTARTAVDGEIVIAGRYGTLTLKGNGSYTYEANAEGRVAVGASVVDDFLYTLSDGQGGAGSSHLRVTVTGSNRGDAGNNVFLLTGPGTSASGYDGDDTYIVDNAGDRVIEAADGGTDTVGTSVSFTLSAGQGIETLRTTNDAGLDAIRLGGNAFANTLIGNDGANVLNGGAGADLLYGKGGSDTFAFSSNLGSVDVDRLTDFSVPEDTIQLARAVFRALTTGQLAETAFKDLGNAGAVVDASDRILYNHKNGALSYDADGNGTASTAVQFAVIGTKETLTHLDFLVA